MLTVFLTDDHEVVRRGVAELLNDAAGMKVIGEASTVAQALARIPAVRPDVAVLDVRLPDGGGVELRRELRSRLRSGRSSLDQRAAAALVGRLRAGGPSAGRPI